MKRREITKAGFHVRCEYGATFCAKEDGPHLRAKHNAYWFEEKSRRKDKGGKREWRILFDISYAASAATAAEAFASY